MISILNAIRSVFVGNKEVKSISVGSTVVYEAGNTYTLTSPHIVYSESTSLYASGNNYATIVGTLNIWRLGSLQDQYEVTLVPNIVSGSFLSIYQNIKIKGSNRGTTGGSERTGTVSGTYTFDNGETYQTGNLSVVQEENRADVYAGSSVTLFELGGCEDGETMEIGSGVQSINVNAAELVRHWEYTSGSPDHDDTYALGDSGFWDIAELVNVDNVDWLHIGTSSSVGTVTVDAYTGNSSRTGRISFRDQILNGSSTSYMPVITITQVVADYVLTVTNQTIPATNYEFTIPIVSKRQGSVYTDLTVTISNSTFVNLQYDSSELGYSSSGTVYLPFTCAYNLTATARTATITVRQNGSGGYQKSFTLTQSALSSVFDGISVKAASGNWVIGEITSLATGYKGFLVAKDSPLSTDRAYNFSIGTFEYSYNYNNSYINEISDVEWKIAVNSSTGKATIFIKNQGAWTSVATNRDPYISNGSNTYYGCWVWYNSTEFTALAGTNNNHIEYVGDFVVTESSG